MGINALVVGCGRFGRNYATILAGLGHSESRDEIDSIIITRRYLTDAMNQAAKIHVGAGAPIIGEIVSNVGELETVLQKYNPGFIAIAAKDPTIKDNIHPPYAAAAIKYGTVLCEKPFSGAEGDGKSLAPFMGPNDSELSNPFGLELPMAVIYDQMKQDESLYQRLLNGKKIQFAWVTGGSRPGARDRTDIVDNLSLHPWSLIPEEFEMKSIDVNDRGNEAEITLGYRYDGRDVPVEIIMRYGGNFTGFEVDGKVIGLKRAGPVNTLVDMGGISLDTAIAQGNDNIEGENLFSVDNPLKLHIIAALNGKPIVGLDRTYRSQLFLEMLHGYKPSNKN